MKAARAGQLTSVRVPQPDSVPGNDATYYS